MSQSLRTESPRTSPRKTGLGFTLLEILVATALFSMLMGAYYTAFTDILMLEEYAHNQRAFASVGPSILDLIEDDQRIEFEVGKIDVWKLSIDWRAHPRRFSAWPSRRLCPR